MFFIVKGIKTLLEITFPKCLFFNEKCTIFWQKYFSK